MVENFKSPSKKRLLEIIDSFKDSAILVCGDVIVDRYMWGDVERVSQEAPVPIVDIKKDENRLGGAGNVALNITNLGAKASLVGIVGDDFEAGVLKSLSEENNIEANSLIVDSQRPTSLKTRVIGRTQQLVRIDRESRDTPDVRVQSSLHKKINENVTKYNSVIISDYAKGVVTESLMSLFEELKKDQTTSLLKRAVMLDPHPNNHLIYKGVNFCKPNRKEAENISGMKIKTVEDAFLAGAKINSKWATDLSIVSLSSMGLAMVSEKNIHLATTAQEVFDVSGAGDTVTAVFTLAYSVGADYFEAGTLANLAAGVVVSEVGTVPIRLDQLIGAVQKLP